MFIESALKNGNSKPKIPISLCFCLLFLMSQSLKPKMITIML